VKDETLHALLATREAGHAVVLATDLVTGAQHLLRPFDNDDQGTENPELLSAAARALAKDSSGIWETESARVFLHVLSGPIRVVIVGAVHVAQPLSVMASAAGFDVTVVDPRQAFATPERFPGVRLECSWPDEALARLALDERTAVVTVTHEAKLDDPALQAALRSPVFYIGALGSRRTHAKRLARLEEAGFGVADFERIRAPIGLAIGARSPGEIAASVVAEIVKVLRKLDE